MQSKTHFVVRDRVVSPIDTGVVLSAYAAIAIVVGLTLVGTGVRGLPGLERPLMSLIWIGGAALFAAGCAAWGLALNDDPFAGRRALRIFAVGHLLLGLMVWWEYGAYWHGHGLALWMAPIPFFTGLVLLGAASAGPHLLGMATTEQRVRSRYDDHIRQVARREERARLARDLHDAVKQQLFVIQTAVATAQARFDDDRAGASEALGQVRAAAREATTEMEALLDELQAAPLENNGLIEAVKKQCEALALRTGAEVNFTPGTLPSAAALRPGAHEAIYRVAQEALANVARHARARRVDVSLQSSVTALELRVMDDGAGFDAEAPRSGMGVTNMETRAAEIGGRLSLAPRSPGTAVVLTVPLTNPDVIKAWFNAALFGLLAVSFMVFYGVRGNSSDRRISLVCVGVFGVFSAVRLATVYLKLRRENSR